LKNKIKKNQFEISTGIVGGKINGNKDRLQAALNAPVNQSSIETLNHLKQVN
jgi:hypothetical protein